MIMDRSLHVGLTVMYLPLSVFAAACLKASGTISHIYHSSIVTGMVLWFAVRILLHYADYPALRKSALWLPGIGLVQALLGIAAYMNRIAIDPRHGQCSGIPLP